MLKKAPRWAPGFLKILFVSDMEVRTIPMQEALRIRQEVMYPGMPISCSQLENDDQGTHLGLFVNRELLTVVSLFEIDSDLQFRKFATRQFFQRRGFGQFMMNYILQFAADTGRRRICCNARVSAIPFYQKFGMLSTGNSWEKNGISYIVMEKLFA